MTLHKHSKKDIINLLNKGMKIKKILLMAILLFGYANADITTLEGAKKACEGGIAEGCHNLGLRYASGQGVTQDHSKAKKFYTKACDGGIAGGCYNLGFMYATGRGVNKSYSKAKKLFYKACKGGHTNGCEKYSILNKK